LSPAPGESSIPATLPEKWVDDHADYLFNYAISRVRKPQVAEDLVQDALIAAFKAQTNFEGRSSLRTWLTGILRNKILDYYRKFGRETPFTDLQFFQDGEEGHFNDVDHWLPKNDNIKWKLEGSAVLISAELRQALQECLSKLPSRVADVFVLRDMEELDTDEVCKTLSLTPTNFRVILHRARMALRDCLEVNWFQKSKETK